MKSVRVISLNIANVMLAMGVLLLTYGVDVLFFAGGLPTSFYTLLSYGLGILAPPIDTWLVADSAREDK